MRRRRVENNTKENGMGTDRPNVVVILSDDQGCWAMGCSGNPEIRTPNLDRLAREGIRFENFFCSSPVCSPARATLLTGRIPSQHGVHDWIRGGNMSGKDEAAIEYLRGMTGFTEILARHGYVCGISGKWHLGDSLRPQKRFSHWFVHQKGGGNYNNAPMVRKGKAYDHPGYVTDVITDDALRFIACQARSERRFYLSVHYTAPHSPWVGQHPKDIVDSYGSCPFESCPDQPAHPWQIATAPRGTGEQRREILKGYFAAVTAMDNNIGRILDKLGESGLRGNTLVFFLSDNGMNMGHHGFFGKGNGTFPLNMYDTSVKVPAIASMPGTCPRGILDEELHSQYDFVPTLLDFLGIENPLADGLPGQSFAPLLRGRKVKGRSHVVVFDEYGPVRMIRDKEWKYVHRYPYGPNELYNIAQDPNETSNLAAEPGSQEIITSMKSQLEEFFLMYARPNLDGSREAVYGSGQIDLVGPAGKARKAFVQEFHYMDQDGRRRDERHQPPSSTKT